MLIAEPGFQAMLSRRGLTSVMNDTKWQAIKHDLEDAGNRHFGPDWRAPDGRGYVVPTWRVKYLRETEPGRWFGGYEPYLWGLDDCKYLEWMEFDPLCRERDGILLPERVVGDLTEVYLSHFRRHQIPFTRERDGVLRVWGYVTTETLSSLER